MFNYGYIVNPITNKKVSVYTKTGKKIINNFIRATYTTQFAGGSSKPSEFNTRMSPPFPANECPIGMKKKGRDGIMWEVSKPDKSGTKKWVKN